MKMKVGFWVIVYADEFLRIFDAGRSFTHGQNLAECYHHLIYSHTLSDRGSWTLRDHEYNNKHFARLMKTASLGLLEVIVVRAYAGGR
jgi:hypothetical protein